MNNIEEIIEKAKKFKNNENFEEAIKLLEDLSKIESNSELIKRNLIDILFSYGGYLNDEYILEYDKAIEIFKKIIKLDPKNSKAHYNLGIAYSNLNQTDNALKSYNEAIKIKPDYKFCYYNIGLVYELNGDLKRALEYYNKALDIDPKFPYAVNSREYVRKIIDTQKIEQVLMEQNNCCNNCGLPNRQGAKFCDNCGTKF